MLSPMSSKQDLILNYLVSASPKNEILNQSARNYLVTTSESICLIDLCPGSRRARPVWRGRAGGHGKSSGAPGEPWAPPHPTLGPLSLRRPSPSDCCLPAGPHGKPREGRLSHRGHALEAGGRCPASGLQPGLPKEERVGRVWAVPAIAR